MSSGFRPAQCVQYVQFSNIPRNIFTGYGDTITGGKVRFPDGQFLLYTPVYIQGVTEPQAQISYNHSLRFTEVPCDSLGSPLLVTWWIAETEDYKISEMLYLMMLMSREPTHRVNLSNGNLTDSNLDDNYIRHLTLSYSIADRV